MKIKLLILESEIIDGSKVKFEFGEASLTFSEDDLMEWDKGGRSSRVASVDYHFSKHHKDTYINVDTLPEYLNLASEFKCQVLDDIDNDNLDNYKIVNGSDSIKYTDKTSRKYIKLKKGDNTIITFCGN